MIRISIMLTGVAVTGWHNDKLVGAFFTYEDHGGKGAAMAAWQWVEQVQGKPCKLEQVRRVACPSVR